MSVDFTFGIAVGAIIAAGMNIAANTITSSRSKGNEKKESINLLFGELLSILSHYQYSNIPLRLVDGEDRDMNNVRKKFKFALYGDVRAIENIDKFTHLPPIHIRNILQLSLKIRNNDTLISNALDDDKCVTVELVREINNRMSYVEDCSEALLSYIAEADHKFRKIFEEAKNIHNPNYQL